MLLSLQFLFFQFSSFLLVSPDEKDSCKKMLSKSLDLTCENTSEIVCDFPSSDRPTLVAMWRVRPTGIMIQWMTRRGKIGGKFGSAHS